MTNFWQKRAYSELSTDAADLAKRGLVYLQASKFNIGSSGSVAFQMSTNGTPVQFEFYEISCIQEVVYAELIESASAVTTFGPTIAARNLNRNYTDTHSVTLQAASGISGGIVIANELIGSDKAAGALSTARVHVLKDSTDYQMVFTNLGSQTTTVHFTLGWSEGEPLQYPLVLEPQQQN